MSEGFLKVQSDCLILIDNLHLVDSLVVAGFFSKSELFTSAVPAKRYENTIIKKTPIYNEPFTPKTCKQCNWNFSTLIGWQNHVKSHDKNTTCSTCSKSFKTVLLYRRHLRVHQVTPPVHCPICNKLFKNERSLAGHQKLHGDRESYKCDCCDKNFNSKYRMESHVRKMKNLALGKCEQCEESFFDTTSYKQHVEAKHQDTCLCTICGRRLTNKYALQVHIATHSATHKKKTAEKCPVCSKEVVTLKRHMERRHGGKVTNKSHHCFLCGKLYLTLEGLNLHTMKHQGVMPYKCEYCNKEFLTRNRLKVHVRCHTGEKPYKCDVCNKCFSQKTPLTIHRRRHTGEKPYACDLCEAKFTSRTLLNIHRKGKHKIV